MGSPGSRTDVQSATRISRAMAGSLRLLRLLAGPPGSPLPRLWGPRADRRTIKCVAPVSLWRQHCTDGLANHEQQPRLRKPRLARPLLSRVLGAPIDPEDVPGVDEAGFEEEAALLLRDHQGMQANWPSPWQIHLGEQVNAVGSTGRHVVGRPPASSSVCSSAPTSVPRGRASGACWRR